MDPCADVDGHGASAYLSHLDGIRAFAVLAVLAFHWDLPRCSAGYLGVDAFFVVSGYIITRTSAQRIREGRFGVVDFWKRRVKRLVPAVLLMVAIVLGWQWALDPYHLPRTAKTAVAACLSLANVSLWQGEQSYWSPATEEDPLMHTWSLGVEEQFYLLFPLLAALFWVGSRRVRATPIVVITAASLGIWAWTIGATSHFYLLPARAWELGVGCLWAIVEGQRAPSGAQRWFVGLAMGGAALGLAAVLRLRSLDPAIETAVLQPIACLLTLSLICLGDTGAVCPVLSAPGLSYIGKVSYSLYLWHWPIAAFAFLYAAQVPAASHPVSLGVMTLAAASASYHLLEVPMRYGKTPVPRILGGTALVAVGALVLVLTGSALRQAFAEPTLRPRPEWRHFDFSVNPDELLTDITDGMGASANVAPPTPAQQEWWRTGGVRLGPEGAAQVLVLGDSHGVMLGPAFEAVAETHGLSMALFVAGGGIAPWLEESTEQLATTDLFTASSLAAEWQRVVEAERPELVIIVRRWSYDSDHSGLRAHHTLNWLGARGAKLAFVTGLPIVRDARNVPVGAMERRRGFLVEDGGDLLAPIAPYRTGWPGLVRDRSDLETIDLGSGFRRGGRVRVADGEGWLYVDDNHLSLRGAGSVVPALEAAILELLR